MRLSTIVTQTPGEPSELVFRAAMDDFYCHQEPRTRACREVVQDLFGRPQEVVGYPQEGSRRPPLHPQIDHQPVDDGTNDTNLAGDPRAGGGQSAAARRVP